MISLERYVCLVLFSVMCWQGKTQPVVVVDSVYINLKANLESGQRAQKNDVIAKNHLKLGEYYSKYGIYSEAVSHFNSALRLLQEMPADTLQVWLNNAIGRVDFERRNLQMAQRYFEEAAKLSKAIGYKRGQAISNRLLGACFEKMGAYDKALENELKALHIFGALQDSIGVSMVNENIGSIYEDLENYTLAKSYFLKAYHAVKGSGGSLEANVLNNIGDVYRKTGDYDDALVYTQKALQRASDDNNLDQLESAHKDLSKTYHLMGEFNKAFEHLTIADHYNNEWLKRQNADQLNVLLAIYENKKKENQIQLLEEQTKVGRANQNVLVVALLASLAIGILLFFYRNRKRKAELKLKIFEERALKAELEKRREEEQNLQREIQLKAAALSRYSLHLSQKNKILHEVSHTLKNMASRRHMDVGGKLKSMAKEIQSNLQRQGEWDEFINFFTEIHPDFIKKLSSFSAESLSPSELRLGMLLRLNMTST